MRCLLIVMGVIFLTGCGADKNIALSENFWQEKPKIVIVHHKAPSPSMTVSGEQGLLDMAITRVANDKIIKRLKQADLKWYPNVSKQFSQRLKERAIDTSVDPIPVDNKKSILIRAQGNKVLAIKLQTVGIRRVYSMGFIPGGSPQAYCILSGELLDPNNKSKPLWKSEIEIMQPIKEPWDQPGEFGNLMLALNEATTTAEAELLDSFFSGH